MSKKNRRSKSVSQRSQSNKLNGNRTYLGTAHYSRTLTYETLEDRRLLAADYGDAPAPYSTLHVDNGPRHEAIGPQLGNLRTEDIDGQPSLNADADTSDDGITFGDVRVGQLDATVTVNVQGGAGKIDAWIDFNRDGSWGGPNERIFASQEVVVGDNELTFDVPSWARSGDTLARFRISTDGGLGPNGAADNGEVEDYLLHIESTTQPSGAFKEAVFIDELESESFLVDLNGDGIKDRLGLNQFGDAYWQQVLATDKIIDHIIHDDLGSINNLIPIDIDDDGDIDVLISSSSGFFGFGDVSLYENNGDGTFARSTIARDSYRLLVHATDVDKDGYMDLVIGGRDEVSIYHNNGDQSFEITQSFPAYSIRFLDSADLDLDGDHDIVVASTDKITIYEKANQEYTIHEITGFNFALGFAIADLNGDQFQDFVLSTNDLEATFSNPGRVLSFTSDGEYHFSERLIAETDYQPSRIVPKDIDADGDIDLQVVDNNINRDLLFINSYVVELGTNDAYQIEESQEGTIDVFFQVPTGTDFDQYLAFSLQGQATPEIDYLVDGHELLNGRSGVIKIPSGQTSATLRLTLVDDPFLEIKESLIVVLTDENVVLGATPSVEFVVISNEYGADMGDAPEHYRTSLANNGPTHTQSSNTSPVLGDTVSYENDGKPSQGAIDDEDDGVLFGEIRVGQNDSTLTVNISGGPGKLDAWIDFDGDGNWSRSEEQIFSNHELSIGENEISFSVPSSAISGTTYARFRVSTEGGLEPIGPAGDGEVEDYQVIIEPPVSSAGAFNRPVELLALPPVFGQSDIDRDGDIDYVVWSQQEGILSWIEQIDDGTYESHFITSELVWGVDYLEVVDFDKDGYTDIVISDWNNILGLGLFINDGNGGFNLAYSLEGVRLGVLDIVDFDLDGDNDILASTYNEISYYEQVGDLEFISHELPSNVTTSNILDIHATDIDKDGDLDVLSASTFSHVLVLHENQGDLIFSDSAIAEGVIYANSVMTVDMDGDGDLDVVGTSTRDSDFSWHENVSGTFVENIIVQNTQGTDSMVASDMDGDGDIDIVVVDRDSKVAYYLRNNGHGLFEDYVISADTEGIHKVFAEDFDQDGDLDLLGLNGLDNLVLLENTISASITATDDSILEETQDQHHFTLRLSHSIDVNAEVKLAISGDAIYGVDYILSGDLIFREEDDVVVVMIPAGETESLVYVNIVDDSYYELQEFIEIVIDETSAIPPDYEDNSLIFAIAAGEDLADFGDAPNPYPTFVSDLGAIHSRVSPYPEAPQLGDLVSYESDGSHSPNANSDSGDDGVIFSELRVGQLGATISIDVQGAPGYVDAWIDFDGDGSWNETHDRILGSVPVALGTHQFQFNVPVDTISDVTYARVRISSDGDLGYAGLAADGEVEDYAVEILPPVRTIGEFSEEKELFDDFSSTYQQMELVDIDNDSDLDLIVDNFYSELTLIENKGDGSYVEHRTTIPAEDFKLVDIDGNGKPEIVRHIPNYYNNSLFDTRQNIIFTYSVNDQLEFTSNILFTEDSDTGEPIFTPSDFLDIDGDGLIDMIGSFDNDIAILRANSGGDYSREILSISSIYSYRTDNLIVGDFDDDGDLDFVGGDNSTFAPLNFYENKGNGVLEATSIANQSFEQAELIDIDNDGDLDVVFLTSGPFDEGVYLLPNDGGQFNRLINLADDNVNDFVVADFDGDGDVDIAASIDAFSENLVWHINRGNGNFERQIIGSENNSFRTLAAGDLDGNGAIDLLASINNFSQLNYFQQPLLAEISLSDSVVNELESDPILFTIAFGSVVAEDTEVPFTLSGTAEPGVDYVIEGVESFNGTTGTAVIPAGEDLVQLVIRPVEDGIDELSETITILVGQLPTNGIPFDSQIATSTILGDPDYGDYGDAPYPYPVSPLVDGPGHAASGPILGPTRSTESQGINSADALGDSGDDGITFAPINVGEVQSQIIVNVQNAPDGARLDGWIDFNADGSWAGNRERIFGSVEVVEGDNLLTFELPVGIKQGTTYARFRISTLGGLDLTGNATDGEVEDYAVEILPATPGPLYFVENQFDQISPFGTHRIPVDFDKDGDHDLISADASGLLNLLVNNGAGQFDTQALSSFSYRFIEGVVVEDYDNDGDWDVLLLGLDYQSIRTISWLENRGEEGYQSYVVYQDGAGASGGFSRIEAVGIEVGDLNGDGKLDFVLPMSSNSFSPFSQAAGSIDIVLSQEDGAYLKSTISELLSSVRNVEIIDLDGDGQLDLLTNGNTPNSARIFHNDDLKFSELLIDEGPTDFDSRYAIGNIRAVDVDGDGDHDLFPTPSYSFVTGPLVWYENTDNGYIQKYVEHSSDIAVDVSFADLDADGDSDLIYHAGTQAEARFYENRIAGDFDNNSVVDQADYDFWVNHFGDTFGTGMSADMNNNGTVDIADYTIWRDSLGNSPTRMFLPILSTNNVYSHANSQLADLNGDGDLDLVGLYSWYGNVPGVNADASPLNLDEVSQNYFDIVYSIEQPLSYDLELGIQATGIAIAGLDYNVIGASSVSQELVNAIIPAGETEVSLTLNALDDPYSELNERFGLTLQSTSEILSLSELTFVSEIISDEVGGDFGDAPVPYPSTIINDGARHSTRSFGDIRLGGSRMNQVDAMPSVGANSDISDNGVSVPMLRVGDTSALIEVDVQGSSGYLDAWIDFNGDGTWNGNQERIFASKEVQIGLNQLTFEMPGNSVSGETYARIRVSSRGGLSPYGLASDGEVEDYQVTILPPLANSDAPLVKSIVNSSHSSPSDIVSIDIDQDGDLDIVSASYNEDKIIWHENDGHQNFTPHEVSSSVDLVSKVIVEDFDNDGDFDIAAIGVQYDELYWFQNDGNQKFAGRLITRSSDQPSDLVTADINNDGYFDLVVASASDDKVVWFRNNKGLGFAPNIITTEADSANGVIAVDLDYDGDIDILSSSYNDDTLRWFKNTDTGEFIQITIAIDVDGITDVKAADLDADGDIDLITTSIGDDQIRWYENVGEEQFVYHIIDEELGNPTEVNPYDYDGDGDTDLLVVSDTQALLYENIENGATFVQNIVSNNLVAGSAIQASDFDSDGDLEILVASRDTDQIIIYEDYLQGDLNRDGLIDTADFEFWKNHIGATNRPGLQADANQDGRVDIADYTTWRDRYAEQESILALLEDSSPQLIAGLVYLEQGHTQPSSEHPSVITQTQVQQDQTQRRQLLLQAYDSALQGDITTESYDFTIGDEEEIDEDSSSLELAFVEL